MSAPGWGRENHLLPARGQPAGRVVLGQAHVPLPAKTQGDDPANWLCRLQVDLTEPGGLPDDWGPPQLPRAVYLVPAGAGGLGVEAYLSQQLLLAQQLLRQQLLETRQAEAHIRELEAANRELCEGVLKASALLNEVEGEDDPERQQIIAWLDRWRVVAAVHQALRDSEG